MLKRAIIKKLNGHFNYDLKFENKVTSITGPNGYGKKSVLKIIYDLLKGNPVTIAEYVRLEFSDGSTIISDHRKLKTSSTRLTRISFLYNKESLKNILVDLITLEQTKKSTPSEMIILSDISGLSGIEIFNLKKVFLKISNKIPEVSVIYISDEKTISLKERKFNVNLFDNLQKNK